MNIRIHVASAVHCVVFLQQCDEIGKAGLHRISVMVHRACTVAVFGSAMGGQDNSMISMVQPSYVIAEVAPPRREVCSVVLRRQNVNYPQCVSKIPTQMPRCISGVGVTAVKKRDAVDAHAPNCGAAQRCGNKARNAQSIYPIG